MKEERVKMKRVLLVAILLVGFLLIFSSSVFAFGALLDFNGAFAYYRDGGLSFSYFSEFLPDDAPFSIIDYNAPYVGVGYAAYDFQWDLPGWDDVYEWTLDADVLAHGGYNYGQGSKKCFNIDWSRHFNLGTGSLRDLFDGHGRGQVINFARNHTSGYWPSSGGYYIDGDFFSGDIYFALEDPDLRGYMPSCLNSALGIFEITLDFKTEESVVPEPATLSLISLGMLGFGLLKKRRKI